MREDGRGRGRRGGEPSERASGAATTRHPVREAVRLSSPVPAIESSSMDARSADYKGQVAPGRRVRSRSHLSSAHLTLALFLCLCFHLPSGLRNLSLLTLRILPLSGLNFPPSVISERTCILRPIRASCGCCVSLVVRSEAVFQCGFVFVRVREEHGLERYDSLGSRRHRQHGFGLEHGRGSTICSRPCSRSCGIRCGRRSFALFHRQYSRRCDCLRCRRQKSLVNSPSASRTIGSWRNSERRR
ncbi:hypothetical protein MPTK1_5g02340 [Marchantia polymorpha subsp. ruderalis]|uniref:Uncharacterized protein n=2 Tax=Marchantia polymorpha TaxID=3197 RepID=A0AAF6BE53_MARPO|nr:hypothetical protein MARPO_0147s0027 [Marchantia polymorpha]BBN10287.1 hypothetical protein Mp_5g02340 [Marchantia polymorpha subsp. ruderalis]|eukprot:PTQ29148.1 hypothetical protein MARPO_0147s0027 [Marchantia polymorpha]